MYANFLDIEGFQFVKLIGIWRVIRKHRPVKLQFFGIRSRKMTTVVWRSDSPQKTNTWRISNAGSSGVFRLHTVCANLSKLTLPILLILFRMNYRHLGECGWDIILFFLKWSEWPLQECSFFLTGVADSRYQRKVANVKNNLVDFWIRSSR